MPSPCVVLVTQPPPPPLPVPSVSPPPLPPELLQPSPPLPEQGFPVICTTTLPFFCDTTRGREGHCPNDWMAAAISASTSVTAAEPTGAFTVCVVKVNPKTTPLTVVWYTFSPN